MTRRLLWCGVLAGPLFVLSFLVQGAVKGGGYDPMRHPVSSLALGPHGWAQVATFIVTGTLIVAFAVALRPWWGAVFVGLVGIGLIGAGAFRTDPVSGYPPGTPPLLTDYTTLGALHDAFSAPVFLGLAVAPLVLARGGWRWAVYSVLSGLLVLVGFVMAGSGFAQEGPVEIAGLLQRLTLVVGFGWLTALAVRRLRAVPPA